jgi:hypothetical protein
VANFTQSRSQNGSPKHCICQSSIHTWRNMAPLSQQIDPLQLSIVCSV